MPVLLRPVLLNRITGPIWCDDLLVFLVLASVKTLESTLSLTTTTNRFHNKYAINPNVLGVDVFPNLGNRASQPSHLNTKKGGGGGGRAKGNLPDKALGAIV